MRTSQESNFSPPPSATFNPPPITVRPRRPNYKNNETTIKRPSKLTVIIARRDGRSTTDHNLLNHHLTFQLQACKTKILFCLIYSHKFQGFSPNFRQGNKLQVSWCKTLTIFKWWRECAILLSPRPQLNFWHPYK